MLQHKTACLQQITTRCLGRHRHMWGGKREDEHVVQFGDLSEALGEYTD
jgi:hypothetical protein